MANDLNLSGASNRRPSLETVSSVMFIALCAVAIWVLLFGRPAPASALAVAAKPTRLPAAALLPTDPISLEGAVVQGAKDAKAVLVEYSDFQCPFCGKFARETLPELEKQYVASGKVLLAFRNLPLAQIHPFAQKAAEAAVCAQRQGHFWQMHDQLFLDQTHLDESSLRGRAKTLGLNVGQFSACLDTNQATSDVERDAASGTALKVSGTPTFFLGTMLGGGRVKVLQALTGAQPLAQFEGALDRIVGESK